MHLDALHSNLQQELHFARARSAQLHPAPIPCAQTYLDALHSNLLLELESPSSEVAVEQAARLVLQGARDVKKSSASALARAGTAAQAAQTPVDMHAVDDKYLESLAQLLLAGRPWGKQGAVSEAALTMMLEAVSELMGNGVAPLQLAGTRDVLPALVQAVKQGSHGMQTSGLFLLSQIALVGPDTAVEISVLPGLAEACYVVITQDNSPETLTNTTALLINNMAALGGEDAVRVLSAHGMLMRELAACLDYANDAATLQRLTGVFNHLSRSPVRCAAPLATACPRRAST